MRMLVYGTAAESQEPCMLHTQSSSPEARPLARALAGECGVSEIAALTLTDVCAVLYSIGAMDYSIFRLM